MKLDVNNKTGEIALTFTDSQEAVNLLEAAALGADDLGVRRSTEVAAPTDRTDRQALSIFEETRGWGKTWDKAAVQVLEEATF